MQKLFQRKEIVKIYKDVIKVCMDTILNNTTESPFILCITPDQQIAHELTAELILNIYTDQTIQLIGFQTNEIRVENPAGNITTIRLHPIALKFHGARSKEHKRPTVFISAGVDIDKYKESIYLGLLPLMDPVNRTEHWFEEEVT